MKITGATLASSTPSSVTTPLSDDIIFNDSLLVSPDLCVSLESNLEKYATTITTAAVCSSGEMTPDVLTDEEREFDEFLMDAVQWL